MREIEEAASTAFSEYITSCTVIITSHIDSFEHGSGVAVRYKGKTYIVTAAHVLKPLKDNSKLRFIGRPAAPFRNVKKSQLDQALATSATSSVTTVQISKRQYGTGDEDIAALEVLNTSASLPHTIFHDLADHEDVQALTGQQASVFGFPGEIAQQVVHKATGKQAAMANSLHADVDIRDIASAPGRLDPTVYFVTDYIFDNGSCDPKGMSGCGIWSRPEDAKGKVWVPCTTKLLGIQSSFYPRSRLLVVARIRRVLDLLSRM